MDKNQATKERAKRKKMKVALLTRGAVLTRQTTKSWRSAGRAKSDRF